MPTKSQSVIFSSRIRTTRADHHSFATVASEISKSYLRRGRITAELTVGESSFEALMEPDGKLGHWFVIPPSVMKKEALEPGRKISFSLTKLAKQPEPTLPRYFLNLLKKSSTAQTTWKEVTTLAKIDWVHWMESAKQFSTRQERAINAIDMLEKGKKRVCCFDPSGFYSKALSCPAEDGR
jgi:Bacteriocin-protection, YdeI or OmpD-Associated/Domain of unknown function (DUF1905)